MERAGGDGVLDAETPEPRPELACGFARERERQDVAWIDHSLARLPRDAAREHARLSRTCSREDRERRGSTGDRVALCRVETAQQVVHSVHGTSGVRRDTGLTNGEPRERGQAENEAKENEEGPE